MAIGLGPDMIPDLCCDNADEAVNNASGMNSANPPGQFSEGPVRWADGIVKFSTVDLESDGFGQVWGQTRSWSNAGGITPSPLNGSGWIISQLPYLILQSGVTNDILVVSNGTNVRDFIDNGDGTFTEDAFLLDQLSYSSTNQEYSFVDTAGDKIKFSDWSTSLPVNQQGQFKSYTDPDSNVTSVTSRDSTGRPTEVQRSVTIGGVTTTESLLYSYNASGYISNVTLRRKVGAGSWTTVRQVAYTYYASGEAHGNVGNLKLAVIQDASSNALDTKYYRYYTGETGGYAGALKYVFNAQSYARLVAALGPTYPA
jgi:hypothetical protein